MSVSQNRSVRDERIAKGLCPNCGEISAPYYLCGRCRCIQLLSRALNRAEKQGVVNKQKKHDDKRVSLWSHTGSDAPIGYKDVTDPNDKRFRPRFRNLPVDVEAELVAILRDRGIPMHEDDMIRAWGQLRARAGKGSVAHQMHAIIAAEHKRKDRRQKKARATG